MEILAVFTFAIGQKCFIGVGPDKVLTAKDEFSFHYYSPVILSSNCNENDFLHFRPFWTCLYKEIVTWKERGNEKFDFCN